MIDLSAFTVAFFVIVMWELTRFGIKKIWRTEDIYIAKVTECDNGSGFPGGRINYVPKRFIGKKVEVKEK